MNLPVVWRPQVDTIYQMDGLQLMHQCVPQSIDAIITDLPYGTTACSWDTIIPFEALWAAVRHCLKPRGVFVTTASQPFTSALVMSNPKWFRYEWVWIKTAGGFILANRQPLKRHENVLVFCSLEAPYYPVMSKGRPYIHGKTKQSGVFGARQNVITVNNGERYPTSVLHFNNANTSDKAHPTQKPVALYEYLIRTYTQPGELVLDPCCGSGTTALAARNTGRHWICGDTDAGYVEIARGRFKSGIDRLNAKAPAALDDLPLFRKETA